MKMDSIKVRFMPLLMLVSGVAMGFLIRPFRWETESPKMRHVRIQVTRMTCRQLMTAAVLYQMDTGALPKEGNGVRDLILNPGVTNWNGPYLKSTEILFDACILDEWGRPIRYSVIGGEPVFTSPGPDGQLGTEDDIPENMTPNNGVHDRLANSPP